MSAAMLPAAAQLQCGSDDIIDEFLVPAFLPNEMLFVPCKCIKNIHLQGTLMTHINCSKL